MIRITNTALDKINEIYFINKNNNLKFRIYIFGGGCNGLKYEFILDKYHINDDLILNKNPFIISDNISFFYLKNSIIDYKIKIISSYFNIINTNYSSVCSCGMSFNF